MIAIESTSGISADSLPPGFAWMVEAFEAGIECNSGGPASRNREMNLRASVLGAGSQSLSCPMVRSVGLDFCGQDPVSYMRKLLQALDYESPEAARFALLLRAQPCVCRADPEIKPTRVKGARPELVLEQALVLGLSTTSLFDPARPVVWTRASLSRRLNLFDVRGFYA